MVGMIVVLFVLTMIGCCSGKVDQCGTAREFNHSSPEDLRCLHGHGGTHGYCDANKR